MMKGQKLDLQFIDRSVDSNTFWNENIFKLLDIVYTVNNIYVYKLEDGQYIYTKRKFKKLFSKSEKKL